MRDHRSPAEVIREWRLPRAEREAAAAERRAESQLRRERDNQETAARRAAALEAEARRGVGGGAAVAEPSLRPCCSRAELPKRTSRVNNCRH